MLIANAVRLLSKEAEAPRIGKQEAVRIRALAGRGDCWDVVGESLAPSICGQSWVKKAVALLLLGGNEKNLANGTHLRG